MADLNLKGLTRGELATIVRIRQGLTQREMAMKAGVHRNTYSKVEQNTDTKNIELNGIKELTPQEQCYIKRKRKGFTQQECADMLGITRFWYNQMERGNESSDMLIKFWS